MSVNHHDACFGFALNRVDDVGGAERNIKIRYIVLMKERGVVSRHMDAKHADVLIFKDQMMVRFVLDGHSFRRFRCLSGEWRRQKERENNE